MMASDVKLSSEKEIAYGTHLNSISTRREVPFLIRSILLRPIYHIAVWCIRHVYFRQAHSHVVFSYPIIDVTRFNHTLCWI